MSLDPCPSSPNCVSTQAESSDTQHYMEALDFAGTPASVLDAVEAVLKDAAGAEVKQRTDRRVEAVFTSRIFRFKDDVIFAVDADTRKLHFRSASRMGHSDLGVNRKRMLALLPKIKALL